MPPLYRTLNDSAHQAGLGLVAQGRGEWVQRAGVAELSEAGSSRSTNRGSTLREP